LIQTYKEYSKKGARIYAQKSGNRKQHQRISVIAGLVNRSTLIAPCYFNCYTDTAVFNTLKRYYQNLSQDPP
jgi:hypothetical protein